MEEIMASEWATKVKDAHHLATLWASMVEAGVKVDHLEIGAIQEKPQKGHVWSSGCQGGSLMRQAYE